MHCTFFLISSPTTSGASETYAICAETYELSQPASKVKGTKFSNREGIVQKEYMFFAQMDNRTSTSKNIDA